MAFIMLGGHGTISVTANVAPRLMHELCVAAAKGDGLLAAARAAPIALLSKKAAKGFMCMIHSSLN
jgi:4-hydroxy-tetrahydrodipicolinate synthase